ncbi:hypothetical protein C8R44DRAFT_987297 [Mycena epipterygia]|nr:hypothetical protein C8R44DRAFT_987297 [Mycena epipterygia]
MPVAVAASPYLWRLRRPAIHRAKDGWKSTSHQELLRSILDARKMWKISDRGQAIWSLELETALLEGLAQYQPTACRETIMLGRFPRRNQFISQYIWKKTGQHRTAKQVGSRLQQLRESDQSQALHDLLFPSPPTIFTRTSSNLHNSTLSDLSVSTASHLVIFIDILPDGYPQPSEDPPCPWWESQNVIHVSSYPRPLDSIDPTVAFATRSPILAVSRFTVCSEDTAHTETSPLTQIDTALPDPTFLYRTALVPAYWKTILESPDPSRYTIFHQVVNVDGAIVFSATYCLRYTTGFKSPITRIVSLFEVLFAVACQELYGASGWGE